MSLHNFNSNTKSWKMYTNTLTSISGDDLLVAPSYGKNLILEVSANNDIFFKKGAITKRFDNLVSDYLDMSFVREASFNSLNSQVKYILQEISGSSALNLITSGISNDLLIKSYAGQDIVLEVSGNSEIIFKRGDISYNLDDLIGGGGGFSQSSDYATYNILDITGKIIFTDNSTNVQYYNDASLNNVDISGSLKVAGSISAPNIYTKTEIDNSFTNVYTKNQVYNKTEIDASFTNVYTKNQVYTKSEVDNSFTNVYTKNQVYTKTEIDASLANVYTKSLDVCGNVTFRGSTLYVPSSFTIDPVGHEDNTGTVLINGNLVVQGVTTTINSSVVDISDKILVLASNASNSLHADGAGFEISGAKVNLLYNNSSNTFRSSIGMSISGNVVPVSNSVGSLGETGKIWDIAYIRELNVTNFTNSIDGSKIASGTISSTQIENGSILTVDISDHAITYEKIAANAVTNTRIANGAVTHAKLSSDCVQSHNIVDGTIMDVDISTNAAISGSKIANSSITNDKINQSNNWTFSQLTSTSANIRDVSVTNIDISGNIVPLHDLSSNLGSSLKRWGIIYTNDLSVNNINGQPYTGGGYTKTEIDVSFVSKELFDASLSSIQLSNVYTKTEIDVSFVSKELFETSYNFLLSSVGTSNESGDGGYFQNNDYALYDILNITDTIIFTDNSNNEINNDVSFNNVDICGSLNVAGSISAPNIYTKTEIDLSFTNVYSKLDVLDSSLANVIIHVDASFLNVYTRGQIDVSFVSKELFDASLSSIQVSNVYTKNEVDVSFVSKQLFETSYNVLLSAIGTGGGGGSGSGSGGGGGSGGGTSSIAKKFYNQDWNLLGQDITFIKDLSAIAFMPRDSTPDGYTVLVQCPYSIITATGPIDTPNERRNGIAVFNFNTITNSWVQKGNTILAPRTYTPLWFYTGNQNVTAETGIMGSAIDDSGNRIAFSTTRSRYGPEEGQDLGGYEADNFVYDYDGTSWIQVGNRNYVPTSNDGEHKYTFVNSVLKLWKIIGPHEIVISTFNGTTFITDATPLQIPYSLMQNALPIYGYMYTTIGKNGNTIAIIMKQTFAVFIFNGTSWQQHGSSITDLRLTSDQRYSIKISYDGSRIILPNWDETVNGDVYAGRTTVYGYDNTIADWKIIGQEIVYEEKFEPYDREGLGYGGVFSGHQISGDGNTIVLGTGVDPIRGRWYGGLIQVYKYSSASNYWSKIGREIQGITRERPGQYITLSYDGSVMSIDGEGYVETYVEPWMFDNAFPKGRIRVYEIEVDPSFSSLSSGSSSSVDAYSKIEIDASFSNVYSKLDVLDSSLANVYTINQIDVSFVSKQVFDASINALAANSGSGSSTLKFSNNLWNKLGFDISGSGNDNLGSKIALSDDGTTIAVAVPNDDTSGTDFGAVIIYKYINYNWQRLGNKIAVSPAATNGSYASELAISGNGTIIAFLYNYDIYEDINYGGTIYNELISYSVVKSFSYNNTVWNETGSVSIASKNYNGNSYSPYTSMSFSRDGSTLAMGRWGADANKGETYVYKFIDSSWNKYGPTIIPPFTSLAAGFKVSLSSNGNIIAVGNWEGSSWPNTTLSRAGSVIVYSYYSNTWNIMGEIIRGKKSYDQGHYIKLSGDGQILAIGAYGVDNYDNGLDSGAAYIYKYNTTNNSWNQLGQTIIPFAELHFEENTYTYFGASIALSVDGNTIAITQQGYDGEIFTSPNAGRCIVYKYINNYWSQYGQYIPGFEYEGSSDIALSSDGATLAYSSQNFKNGIGRVRVFGINNVSSSSSSSSSSLTSDVASLLASLTSRIAMLEATAIIRSFDTIVGPVNSFNIPIDLSNNESLQIDMSVKITGEGGYKMFLKYNTESSTANLWRYFGGRFVYGEYGDGFALWGEDMLNENNGLLVEGPNTNETIIIRIEVFRSYDRASPTQKFWYKASTLFHWSDLGLSRIDCQGETSELSSLIPTALYFNIAPQAQSTTNSSNSFMNVSYSIIKDMRRTALGGPIL